MNRLIRVVQVIVAMISTTLLGLYFYKLYNPDKSFAEANPYLFKWKYFDIPTKEELRTVIDDLTGYYPIYGKDFYAGNSHYLSRSFYDDITDRVKKEASMQKLVKIETEDGDIYCKGEIKISFGMDLNIRTQTEMFFIDASWSPSNECRKYWWGGKNPRALQANQNFDLKKELRENSKKAASTE
ncbi:hypothetical protein [Moraxella cuniculi]|uniref:Uncharacterized protein n=1 Tax=Moraxella cuniculi TaxID=34061 RepID=A0A3S4SDU2_9GAMM|nr:hypothetical protein [Moraxella cuniculi]VEG13956.1 Uncharacterised protein [Moraxella cuniculi]